MKQFTNDEIMTTLQEIRSMMDYWEKPLDPDKGWYSGDKAERMVLDSCHGYTVGEVREIIYQLYKKGYLKFSDYRIGGGAFKQLIAITKKGRKAAMQWVFESGMNISDWYLEK